MFTHGYEKHIVTHHYLKLLEALEQLFKSNEFNRNFDIIICRLDYWRQNTLKISFMLGFATVILTAAEFILVLILKSF